MNRKSRRVWSEKIAPGLEAARCSLKSGLSQIRSTVVPLLLDKKVRLQRTLRTWWQDNHAWFMTTTVALRSSRQATALVVVLAATFIGAALIYGNGANPETGGSMTVETAVTPDGSMVGEASLPAAHVQADQAAITPADDPQRIRAFHILVPEREDPYGVVLKLRDQIRTETEQLFPTLVAPLPPRDAAYLVGLRRIQSPEQFVRELGCWLEENENAGLVSADHRAKLTQLQQECIHCQQLISALSR